jgi:hypothetical protein
MLFVGLPSIACFSTTTFFGGMVAALRVAAAKGGELEKERRSEGAARLRWLRKENVVKINAVSSSRRVVGESKQEDAMKTKSMEGRPPASARYDYVTGRAKNRTVVLSSPTAKQAAKNTLRFLALGRERTHGGFAID